MEGNLFVGHADRVCNQHSRVIITPKVQIKKEIVFSSKKLSRQIVAQLAAFQPTINNFNFLDAGLKTVFLHLHHRRAYTKKFSDLKKMYNLLSVCKILFKVKSYFRISNMNICVKENRATKIFLKNYWNNTFFSRKTEINNRSKVQ